MIKSNLWQRQTATCRSERRWVCPRVYTAGSSGRARTIATTGWVWAIPTSTRGSTRSAIRRIRATSFGNPARSGQVIKSNPLHKEKKTIITYFVKVMGNERLGEGIKLWQLNDIVGVLFDASSLMAHYFLNGEYQFSVELTR